jgi:hypothetical protein
MSANNQTLIVRHKDKYLVYENVNAESWGWNEETNLPAENELKESDATIKCDTLNDAIIGAKWLEHTDPTEYGIVKDVLYKDGAKVKIVI